MLFNKNSLKFLIPIILIICLTTSLWGQDRASRYRRGEREESKVNYGNIIIVVTIIGVIAGFYKFVLAPIMKGGGGSNTRLQQHIDSGSSASGGSAGTGGRPSADVEDDLLVKIMTEKVATDKNLMGTNLSNKELSDLDFSGCILSSATFRNSSLLNINFSGIK